jgi:hypothetical protein
MTNTRQFFDRLLSRKGRTLLESHMKKAPTGTNVGAELVLRWCPLGTGDPAHKRYARSVPAACDRRHKMALSFRWKFKQQSRRSIGNRRLCLVPHTYLNGIVRVVGASDRASVWSDGASIALRCTISAGFLEWPLCV